MTFLTIFIVLVVINVAMVAVSLLSVYKKSPKTPVKVANETTSIIYPLDVLTNSFKKAV